MTPDRETSREGSAPAPRAELIRAIRHAERRITEIGSRWFDSIPPRARWELLQVRAPLQRLLLREPRV